jgi:magnesium transporter
MAEDGRQHEPQEEPAHLEHAAEPSPEDERVASLMAHTIDLPALASAVDQQEAADAADTLETLEDDEAVELLEQMEDQRAADALAEMQKPLAVSVLEDLAEESPDYAGHLLELMAPDDAADLLQALPGEDRRRLLEIMSAEPAEELVELLRYERESAGGLMTTDFLALNEDMTVQQATDFIRSTEVPESAQYALITDDDDHLVGIVDFRALLVARPGERMRDLMDRAVKVVRPQTDREQVAREFDRYDHALLPVVDEEGLLLGIVTVDDVIDIIREEQTEDVQKIVGAGAGEAVYSTFLQKLRGRFPWMGASLLLTCLAALVILGFEDMVRRHTILAFLLPVTAALVGNAGHQALAVTLRGIVLDEVRPDRVMPLVAREALVGLVMGACLGAFICLIVWLLDRGDDAERWRIGAVAALAACVAMGVGTLAGSSIPLIMRRLGADPAQSSAIFLIMITDGASFSVLLGLTWVLL